MSENLEVYVGVEGGGSQTLVLVLNASGEVLSREFGLSSNQWLIGLEECCRRLADLVAKSLEKLALKSPDVVCWGLCLSGAEGPKVQDDLHAQLLKTCPQFCKNLAIMSDTVGSIASAFPDEGIVLISGTGSNCKRLGKDSACTQAGGWGHAIGDEGSGFWIAKYVVKAYFDHEDRFWDGKEYDFQYAEKIIKEHFQVSSRLDMLPHLYTDFDKTKFAGLCLMISHGADDGDALCREAFREAGKWLARHLLSVAPDQKNLQVICVGSVFKSWHLLQPGFTKQLSRGNFSSVRMFRLLESAAVGAALVAARKGSLAFNTNYDDNKKLLFTYDQSMGDCL